MREQQLSGSLLAYIDVLGFKKLIEKSGDACPTFLRNPNPAQPP